MAMYGKDKKAPAKKAALPVLKKKAESARKAAKPAIRMAAKKAVAKRRGK